MDYEGRTCFREVNCQESLTPNATIDPTTDKITVPTANQNVDLQTNKIDITKEFNSSLVENKCHEYITSDNKDTPKYAGKCTAINYNGQFDAFTGYIYKFDNIKEDITHFFNEKPTVFFTLFLLYSSNSYLISCLMNS